MVSRFDWNAIVELASAAAIETLDWLIEYWLFLGTVAALAWAAAAGAAVDWIDN